eukprot:g79860.t1
MLKQAPWSYEMLISVKSSATKGYLAGQLGKDVALPVSAIVLSGDSITIKDSNNKSVTKQAFLSALSPFIKEALFQPNQCAQCGQAWKEGRITVEVKSAAETLHEVQF